MTKTDDDPERTRNEKGHRPNPINKDRPSYRPQWATSCLPVLLLSSIQPYYVSYPKTLERPPNDLCQTDEKLQRPRSWTRRLDKSGPQPLKPSHCTGAPGTLKERAAFIAHRPDGGQWDDPPTTDARPADLPLPLPRPYRPEKKS